jgi:hypothetical protein
MSFLAVEKQERLLDGCSPDTVAALDPCDVLKSLWAGVRRASRGMPAA